MKPQAGSQKPEEASSKVRPHSRKRPFWLPVLSILTLVWSLTAFPEVKAEKPPDSPAQQEEPPPVLSVPKDYHYSAHGRRDPFVNPVPKPKGADAVAPAPARPPGLKGVLVAEAGIVGIVTSKEPSMNVVILSAPGAKAPYFARVGDTLYDAFVKSIKKDTVTFALNAPRADAKAARENVRKLRTTPGEDNK